ncbi:hypothetical protein [Massilia sp. TN1-12]|uniref:hypothetical protein n=1 Tax=Massilia paldalensis TaxID=3377675 RepID=UPI0038502E46
MDLNNMNNMQFDAWLLEQNTALDQSDDERLIAVVSKVFREDTPEGRAQGLLDAANLCIALADKSLGSQVAVGTCLTFTRQ